MAYDPFTLSVIQSGLSAAAEEMFAVLKKTAMSPIIYEVLDVGTGVTDGQGNLVSSGAGIPTFVGVLDKAVRKIIELHGSDINEGDVFVTNDPNFGGVTHLNDVVIAKPFFFEGECRAWTASIAHWGDIGGKVPGSMASDVSEIFAEGLRLPAVKLIAQGSRIEAVFDIMACNSRLPDFVKGDLWAQLAACNRAEMFISSLFVAHGADAVEAAILAGRAEGEARARKGLRALPQGSFEIEEEQDDGQIWRATITITQDRFTVDLRDNPPERAAPFNVSRDGAVISAQMIFKALCDPERFANAGSFAPLVVLTAPGTIFQPGPNAPHGYYFETRIRLFDMLWQCMARALADERSVKLPVGHFASICGTVIAGVHADTGRRYTMVEPQMGGWGATSNRDGMDAMYSTSHGDTFNCPVEICEARYGFDVVEKRLRSLPETSDTHVGGRGVTLRYRMRGEAVLSAGFTRTKVPVWSREGASSGGLNRLSIIRDGQQVVQDGFVSGVALHCGDEILIETANGGNWK